MMSSEKQPGISVISIVNRGELILKLTSSQIGEMLFKVFRKANAILAAKSMVLSQLRQRIFSQRTKTEVTTKQQERVKQQRLKRQDKKQQEQRVKHLEEIVVRRETQTQTQEIEKKAEQKAEQTLQELEELERQVIKQEQQLDLWLPGIGPDFHTYTLKEELCKIVVVEYPFTQIIDGIRFINGDNIKDPTHDELPGIATRATFFYPYSIKLTEEEKREIKRTVEEILNSGCINFGYLTSLGAVYLQIFIDFYHNRKMATTWEWHNDLKKMSVFLYLCYINRFSDITSAEFNLNCGFTVQDTILRFKLAHPFNTCYGLNILHSTACNASVDETDFMREVCKESREEVRLNENRSFVRIVGVALSRDRTLIDYDAEKYWKNMVCNKFKEPSNPENRSNLDQYGNFIVELNKPDDDNWIKDLRAYLPVFTSAKMAGGNNKQKRNRKIKIKTQKRNTKIKIKTHKRKQTKNKRKQTKNKKKLK